MLTDAHIGMSRSAGPGLYEFLMEAELQQYYPGIKGTFSTVNHFSPQNS